MFDKTARWYDAVYATMKDYAAEADALHEILQSVNPGAKTLLDVACGTGLHNLHLSDRYEITGIDADANMLAVARDRNPSIEYVEADMTTFDLGRTFDAVVCLFSSIGYVRTLEGLHAAVERLGAHLAPGGVLVVEPWFSPDQWRPGTPHAIFVDDPDVKIARMSVSGPAEGRISVVDFQYLIATRDGIEHVTEEHRLGLFTDDEHLDAFRAAGLDPQRRARSLWSDRGMYVATKR